MMRKEIAGDENEARLHHVTNFCLYKFVSTRFTGFEGVISMTVLFPGVNVVGKPPNLRVNFLSSGLVVRANSVFPTPCMES